MLSRLVSSVPPLILKSRGSFARCNYRKNFEVDKVFPIFNPLIQQSGIIASHQLKTPLEFIVDPTVDIFQSVRSHPALFSKPRINRPGITILEVLDNHKHHKKTTSNSS